MPEIVEERAAIMFHLGTFHMRDEAVCRVASCTRHATLRVVIRTTRIAVLELCEEHGRQVEEFVGSGCRRIQLARPIRGAKRFSADQNILHRTRGRDISKDARRRISSSSSL